METTMPRMTNGVNVTRFHGTIDALTEMPELAEFKFRARSKWVDGGHSWMTIEDFQYGEREDASRNRPLLLQSDQPPALLGRNAGASPVEYVLAALSSCLTTTLVYHATAQGIEIEDVVCRIEGEIDVQGFLGLATENRPGFRSIRATLRVLADAPEEVLDELIQRVRSHSPVLDTLSNPVHVSVDLETTEIAAPLLVAV